MWTAGIFAGIAFAGIAFLLWFLVHLLREQPPRPRGIQVVRPLGNVALNPFQLQGEWAAIKREKAVVTMHSVWRYGMNYSAEIQKGDVSCGI